IDVRIEVAERQRAGADERGLASVQARVARPPDRSPSPPFPIDEEDVIELVDRFEAEDERRIAVLLEHDGGEERRFETMRAAVPADAAEAAEGGAPVRLLIVGKRVQELLDRDRRPEPRDEPALARRKRGRESFSTAQREKDSRPLFRHAMLFRSCSS